MKGRHADPYEMVAHARGELGRDAAAELLEHCESCSECGNQLAVVLLLRQSRGERSGLAGRRWIAAAAAAVLALGLGVTAYWLGFAAMPAGLAASSPADAARTVPEGRSGDAEGAPTFADLAMDDVPEWSIGVFELALERHGAVSVDEGRPSPIPRLRQAVSAIREGRYARAVELLDACCDEERFHRWGTPLLGIALYAEGEDLDRAVRTLESVVRLRPEQEGLNARWFLAHARLRQGRPEAALEALRGLDPSTTLAGAEAQPLIARIEERLRSRDPSSP